MIDSGDKTSDARGRWDGAIENRTRGKNIATKALVKNSMAPPSVRAVVVFYRPGAALVLPKVAMEIYARDTCVSNKQFLMQRGSPDISRRGFPNWCSGDTPHTSNNRNQHQAFCDRTQTLKGRSNVRPEVDRATIAHDVILSFQPQPLRFFRTPLAASGDVVRE